MPEAADQIERKSEENRVIRTRSICDCRKKPRSGREATETGDSLLCRRCTESHPYISRQEISAGAARHGSKAFFGPPKAVDFFAAHHSLCGLSQATLPIDNQLDGYFVPDYALCASPCIARWNPLSPVINRAFRRLSKGPLMATCVRSYVRVSHLQGDHCLSKSSG